MAQKIFENKLDVIKYKVLRELARQTWAGVDPFMAFNDIANVVVKKGEPPMSCCIYKDRAIIAERVRIGLGEYHNIKDTVLVVPIACDECPKSGHKITDLCRGCVAHSCMEACARKAIYLDEKGYAHIDKSRCVECGRCTEACKYGAITNMVRPCERVCPTGAIHLGEDGNAAINQDKCIVCGECVYECPFGATNDISGMVKVINDIKAKSADRKIYAIVAPAIAVQFPDVTTGQVYSAIKELGFDEVVEVASGADAVALIEAQELIEKGFLTSSCCPAFVEYVNVEFPELMAHVSSTPSPMAITGRMIKEKDPDAEVIFIGPCIAKKWERKTDRAVDYIDHVLTFFELNAMIDSKDIEIADLPEMDMDVASSHAGIEAASSFGRGFASSGGVSDAVKQALHELGRDDFEVKPVVCNGIAECRAALLKARAGKLEGNFIEGMACIGGCVRGNGTLVNKKNTPLHMKNYMENAPKDTLI